MSDGHPSDTKPRIVKGALDRLEGDYAVIVVEGGVGEILWPKTLLADGAVPGKLLVLAMATDQGATAQREQEVRDLLRDIFGSLPDK